MKRACLLFSFVILFHMTISGYAAAETVPYQLSFISPIQTSPTNYSVKGIRFSFISAINNDVSGLDIGFINIAEGNQTGLQIGFYNSSFKSSGLQIGLINKTEYLNGLQIGILNFHREGDFKFLPILNFSF